MLTRNLLSSELKCYGCNEDLTKYDLDCYHEFDGMCENCYSQAMHAAYDDYDKNDFNE
jgi:hypothetical protein